MSLTIDHHSFIMGMAFCDLAKNKYNGYSSSMSDGIISEYDTIDALAIVWCQDINISGF